MFLKILGPAVAATMVMAGSSALAATMMIVDDFTVFQKVVDAPVPSSSQVSSSTVGITVDGNPVNRTMTINNTANANDPENASTFTSNGSGVLSYSNNDGATSDATLTYTGAMDLEISTLNPYFFFDVGFFQMHADFSVTVEDSSGGISTYTEVLTPGFDPYLYFNQFTAVVGGGADFNDVVELTFVFSTTNVPGYGPQPNIDGSLLSISVGVIPLPATGLLLVGGLGFLGGLRRLRRKKAA